MYVLRATTQSWWHLPTSRSDPKRLIVHSEPVDVTYPCPYTVGIGWISYNMASDKGYFGICKQEEKMDFTLLGLNQREHKRRERGSDFAAATI